MGARRWKILRARPLRETSRRSLCRLAFLFGAALPVLLTLAACVAEFFPSYQRARAKHYQTQLSAAIGCGAEVIAVELRDPNHFILHGVKLFHPETSQLIARIQALDVFQGPAGFALRLVKPELSSEHLSSTYHLLHEHVLCRPAKWNHATVAWVDALSIRDGAGDRIQFRNMTLEMKRRAKETHASLTFGLEGVGGQLATLAFSREHTSAHPTTHLKLSTGAQRLPGRWVSTFAPPLTIPGGAATFTGQFELDYGLSDWTLRGEGQLLDVETTAWTERPMMSGFANVNVRSFSLSEQGLDYVRGNLAVKDGRVHDDLLRAALFVGIQPEAAIVDSRSIAHPFNKLALDFELDAGGLALKAGLPDGAVAVDQMGMLAYQYHVGLLPIKNLVFALSMTADADGSNVDLVESPSVRRLVRWLPQPIPALANEQSTYQANAVNR